MMFSVGGVDTGALSLVYRSVPWISVKCNVQVCAPSGIAKSTYWTVRWGALAMCGLSIVWDDG